MVEASYIMQQLTRDVEDSIWPHTNAKRRHSEVFLVIVIDSSDRPQRPAQTFFAITNPSSTIHHGIDLGSEHKLVSS